MRNVCFTCHPMGIEKYIDEQIGFAEKQEKFKGPKNVVVIGGSSGYGLSSVIDLAIGSNAKILNVFFEKPYQSERNVGTAGYWNDFWLKRKIGSKNYKSLNIDAFTSESKKTVNEYVTSFLNKKVDLLIYSVAAPKRIDPESGILYSSTLKTIGKPLLSKTIDIAKKNIKSVEISTATEEEVNSTIKVMGGEDWNLWVQSLINNKNVSPEFKTIAFTYFGGPITEEIYRHGTIGKAKQHLEKTALKLQNNAVEAYVVAAKAIVSKASVFIPTFPLYFSALVRAMNITDTHETPTQHIYRFFSDMLYGNVDPEEGYLYRPDSWELSVENQKIVREILEKTNEDNFNDTLDVDSFVKHFYQINGFYFDTINYEKDFNIREVE